MRYITKVNRKSVRNMTQDSEDLGFNFARGLSADGNRTRLTDAGILRPVTSRKMRSMGVSGPVFGGIRPHNLSNGTPNSIRTKLASPRANLQVFAPLDLELPSQNY